MHLAQPQPASTLRGRLTRGRKKKTNARKTEEQEGAFLTGNRRHVSCGQRLALAPVGQRVWGGLLALLPHPGHRTGGSQCPFLPSIYNG